MFGYVKAHKPELKIREHDAYCGTYCGLCRAMKKTTGALSCLTLNYDFVFLCLVRSVLEKENMKTEYKRCIVHPLKKRPMLSLSPTLTYCAKASAALTYHKAKDDMSDSSRGKAMALRMVFPFFKYIKDRASLNALDDVISDRLDRLTKLENEGCASLDAPASIFGELLGEVFSSGLDGSDRTLAYEIGYHTGKFIYVADAADDYQNDLQSGSYNPIVLTHGDSFSEENKQSIKTALCLELTRLEAAVELMDFSSHKDAEGIIKNIIYLGMPEVMNNALSKEDRSIRKDIKTK